MMRIWWIGSAQLIDYMEKCKLSITFLIYKQTKLSDEELGTIWFCILWAYHQIEIELNSSVNSPVCPQKHRDNLAPTATFSSWPIAILLWSVSLSRPITIFCWSVLRHIAISLQPILLSLRSIWSATTTIWPRVSFFTDIHIVSSFRSTTDWSIGTSIHCGGTSWLIIADQIIDSNLQVATCISQSWNSNIYNIPNVRQLKNSSNLDCEQLKNWMRWLVADWFWHDRLSVISIKETMQVQYFFLVITHVCTDLMQYSHWIILRRH